VQFGRLPDQYTIRARVIPALWVALPLGLAALSWFPDGVTGSGPLWALLTWSGATVPIGQLGRDAGRRKQPLLFQRWGGPPTTRRLRHSAGGNPVTRERLHKKLSALMRKKLPTAAEEAADPRRADEIYEACAEVLKGRTRDHKKFSLLFDESCSYGLRRNLWGLKPLGMALAVLSLGSIAAVLLLEPTARTTATLARVVVPGGITILVLLGWIFVVTPRWVEVPADAYADRLMEAADQM
jgi:hypothetical protein